MLLTIVVKLSILDIFGSLEHIYDGWLMESNVYQEIRKTMRCASTVSMEKATERLEAKNVGCRNWYIRTENKNYEHIKK